MCCYQLSICTKNPDKILYVFIKKWCAVYQFSLSIVRWFRSFVNIKCFKKETGNFCSLYLMTHNIFYCRNPSKFSLHIQDQVLQHIIRFFIFSSELFPIRLLFVSVEERFYYYYYVFYWYCLIWCYRHAFRLLYLCSLQGCITNGAFTTLVFIVILFLCVLLHSYRKSVQSAILIECHVK